jgi:hypothetical protein
VDRGDISSSEVGNDGHGWLLHGAKEPVDDDD